MKRAFIFTVLIAGILFTTCSKKEEEETPTGTGLATIGNNWSGTIGGEPMEVIITANSNNDATAKIEMFQQIFSIKGRVTANEIADYVYSEGDVSKPYTLVKFDANVGDEYVYNKPPWVITRTVLQKDVDLYVEALGKTVKCIVVEEIVPDGLMLLGQSVVGSKIKYWINPTYGIVSGTLSTIWGVEEPIVLLNANIGS